jgi:FMN reductase
MSRLTVLSVVGNPRPDSRTHGLARTLADALGRELPAERGREVDLAELAPGVLDPGDAASSAAVERLLAADVVVLASPTYKATYSGLLKAFLDRVATGALAGKAAIPILLAGAPNHALAVDVHFTPLLLELGAAVPVRGLCVLEADVPAFSELATGWAASHAATLRAAVSRS